MKRQRIQRKEREEREETRTNACDEHNNGADDKCDGAGQRHARYGAHLPHAHTQGHACSAPMLRDDEAGVLGEEGSHGDEHGDVQARADERQYLGVGVERPVQRPRCELDDIKTRIECDDHRPHSTGQAGERGGKILYM
jgi:hypothetical protein